MMESEWISETLHYFPLKEWERHFLMMESEWISETLDAWSFRQDGARKILRKAWLLIISWWWNRNGSPKHCTISRWKSEKDISWWWSRNEYPKRWTPDHFVKWSQKNYPQSLTADHFLMMESEWISETLHYFPLKEWERFSEVMDFWSFQTEEVSETLDVPTPPALLISRTNFRENAWESLWLDRLCGLVIRVSGYRYRCLGFDSRRYQIFWVVVGLERGPLGLVRSIEELLE